MSTRALLPAFLSIVLLPASASAQGGRVELRFDASEITSTGSGTLETDVLAAQISAARALLEGCPGRATHDDPPSGDVTIAISVGEHGAVSSVRAVANTTGTPRVASCVVRVFRRFRFRPRTSGSVTYTVPLHLLVHPVDVLAGGSTPPPTRFVGTVDVGRVEESGDGDFDQQAILRMFATRRAAIGACYQRALATTADLSPGEVVIAFTLEESGSVTNVRVTSSTIAVADVGACVTRVVMGFRFNPGSTEGTVTYSVPITFTALPPAPSEPPGEPL